jgi:hypothetical protein
MEQAVGWLFIANGSIVPQCRHSYLKNAARLTDDWSGEAAPQHSASSKRRLWAELGHPLSEFEYMVVWNAVAALNGSDEEMTHWEPV